MLAYLLIFEHIDHAQSGRQSCTPEAQKERTMTIFEVSLLILQACELAIGLAALYVASRR